MKCVTGWAEWINQDILDQASQNIKTSKSNYFKQDDIEPLPNNLQMKNTGGTGKATCSSDYFAAIECRSVVGHDNPKKTGQNVECSLERGLVCKGQCFDYEIRVYCDCGDTAKPTTRKPVILRTLTKPSTALPAVIPDIIVCDPKIPNIEHPLNCHKYLQCVMGQNGTFVYTEKTCGDTMMFNPKSMVCDWPASVKSIKPECGSVPEESIKPIKYEKQCPPGYVYSNCAIPCNRACNYYNQQLKISGNCTLASNDCIPGCMPIGSALTCEPPKLWRDWQSCVDIQSCTCVGPSGEILKVGNLVFI